MKKVIFVLFMISSLFVFGCNFGKPAYSDIQLDNRSNSNTPRTDSAAGQAADSSEDPIAKAERDAGISNPATQNPAPENKEIPMPSFLVHGKSEIKDLPKYKKANIVNVQVGPINGVSSAMLIFESRDTVENISQFYEKSFKSNGWEVISNIKNPDNFEYTLIKGARDEASVRIKKDSQTGSSFIMLGRIEKPADQTVTMAPVPEKKR